MKKLLYGLIVINTLGISVSFASVLKPEKSWSDRANSLWTSLTTPRSVSPVVKSPDKVAEDLRQLEHRIFSTSISEEDDFLIVEIEDPLKELGKLTTSIRDFLRKGLITKVGSDAFIAVLTALGEDLLEGKSEHVNTYVKDISKIFNTFKQIGVKPDQFENYATGLFKVRFNKEYSEQTVKEVEKDSADQCRLMKAELESARKLTVDKDRELARLQEEQKRLQSFLDVEKSKKSEVQIFKNDSEKISQLSSENSRLEALIKEMRSGFASVEKMKKDLDRARTTERKLLEAEQRIVEFEGLEREVADERLEYEKKFSELKKRASQCMQKSMAATDAEKSAYDESVDEMRRAAEKLKEKDAEIARLRTRLEVSGAFDVKEPVVRKSVNADGEEEYE